MVQLVLGLVECFTFLYDVPVTVHVNHVVNLTKKTAVAIDPRDGIVL